MPSRRRVGKTALINSFVKNKDALFYIVTEESEKQNRNAFKDLVAGLTGNELLKSAGIERWELIFQALLDYKTSRKN